MDNSPTQATDQVTAAEEREARATLGNDFQTLDELWSEHLVVSSTANLVLNKNQALMLFRGGRIRLKTFERRVSKVALIDQLAIATGNESFTVKDDPTGKEPSFDDLIVCSYMNAWRLEGADWKLIARHVGVVGRMPNPAKA